MKSNVSRINSDSIEIRNYVPKDLNRIYEICLQTGDSGKDATNLYYYPQLLGDFYAAPYVTLEPDLAIVATIDNIPYGYILGTKDTKSFAQRAEKEWFPSVRQKYSDTSNATDKDNQVINLINNGYEVKNELSEFPAHLHIDLLPELQGKGLGRKLIGKFISLLKEKDVSALHLEVGKKNIGAIEFYKKVGFKIIEDYKHSIAFGIKIH